jgi:hypothetical protein
VLWWLARQQVDINNTNRVVGLLGSAGFGWGVNVIPYLRKQLEG